MHQIRLREVKLKFELFYMIILKFNIFCLFYAKNLRNMLIDMCLMGVIRKIVSGNKKRIFGMHEIKPKQVKLKLELFL